MVIVFEKNSVTHKVASFSILFIDASVDPQIHISHNQYMEYLDIRNLLDQIEMLTVNTIRQRLNIGWWLTVCLTIILIICIFGPPLYEGIWGMGRGLWDLQMVDIGRHALGVYQLRWGIYGLIGLTLCCELLNRGIFPQEDYAYLLVEGMGVMPLNPLNIVGNNMLDTQNVHDTVIQKYLVKAVEELRRRETLLQPPPPLTTQESLQQIKESFRDHPENVR